ncbi:MAG: mechanosensitive ion channel [Chlamydiae bacterium]|nr:mechanosensitive ion channel [Chlamydiota bacterium]
MDKFYSINYSTLIDKSSIWMVEIFLGLGALLLLQWVVSVFIRKISRKEENKASSWTCKIDVIILTPFKVLCAALATYYIIHILAERFSLSNFAESTRPFISSIFVICITWMAIRWKKHVLHALQYHPKMVSSGLGHTLGKLLSMVIYILSILIILQVFQLDIWPLLAFGGIGAATVGFAAKDVISNFCGGLMLSITRPFLVGDQISLPSQNLEGPVVVEEIGWYLTVIRDKDKRPVYLPNAIFSNALVINSSRMSHRRILEHINIRHSDFSKLKTLTENCRVFLKAHPSVDPSYEPLVFLNTVNESALGIYLDAYVVATELPEYLAVKEEILVGIYQILDKEGVKMPVQTFAIESTLKL